MPSSATNGQVNHIILAVSTFDGWFYMISGESIDNDVDQRAMMRVSVVIFNDRGSVMMHPKDDQLTRPLDRWRTPDGCRSDRPR